MKNLQMQKLLTFFSAKIIAYMPIFNDQSFNDTLTYDIVSFEQLGSVLYDYSLKGQILNADLLSTLELTEDLVSHGMLTGMGRKAIACWASCSGICKSTTKMPKPRRTSH